MSQTGKFSFFEALEFPILVIQIVQRMYTCASGTLHFSNVILSSFDKQSYWHSLQAIFRVAFVSLVKQLLVQKLSYENVHF